ncbi:MAG: hypothetical protein ACK5MP_10910 [Nostocoides sp.]
MPYPARYSTHVQVQRGIGAEATLRQFLTFYAAGRVTSADKLAVTGAAGVIMVSLPANFAQATRNAIVSVHSSPTIRAADLLIDIDGHAFHACLVHPDRAWRVASIAEQPCASP